MIKVNKIIGIAIIFSVTLLLIWAFFKSSESSVISSDWKTHQVVSSNDKYIVELSYPNDFLLDPLFAREPMFYNPDRLIVISVPTDYFDSEPKIKNAFLFINYGSSIVDSEKKICEISQNSWYYDPLKLVGNIAINGEDFSKQTTDRITSQDTNYPFADIYTTIKDEACYQVSVDVYVDDKTIERSNPSIKRAFGDLETVLKTLKFIPNN